MALEHHEDALFGGSFSPPGSDHFPLECSIVLLFLLFNLYFSCFFFLVCLEAYRYAIASFIIDLIIPSQLIENCVLLLMKGESLLDFTFKSKSMKFMQNADSLSLGGDVIVITFYSIKLSIPFTSLRDFITLSVR